MELNKYRDEVGEFLEQMSVRQESISQILGWLDEEIFLLKDSLDDPQRLTHQIYDVLYLLFEIAAMHNLDLDTEWIRGKEEKQLKYLGK